MPENSVSLFVGLGNKNRGDSSEEYFFGVLDFSQLRSRTYDAIEFLRSDLIEKLKKFDGPRLSLDTPLILDELKRTEHRNASIRWQRKISSSDLSTRIFI